MGPKKTFFTHYPLGLGRASVLPVEFWILVWLLCQGLKELPHGATTLFLWEALQLLQSLPSSWEC